MLKVCPSCGVEKDISEFNTDKSRKDGVTAQCRSCRSIRSAKYRAENNARRKAVQADWRKKNAERLKARGAARRLEKRAQCLVAAARTRAKRKGIVFALDDFVSELQARIDQNACELSGFPFDLSPGRKANSPSLDRIEPSKGYTPDNVRVICHALNAALGDWGEKGLCPILAAWRASSSNQ